MREKRETQEASGQTSEEIESEIICTAKIHDISEDKCICKTIDFCKTVSI